MFLVDSFWFEACVQLRLCYRLHLVEPIVSFVTAQKFEGFWNRWSLWTQAAVSAGTCRKGTTIELSNRKWFTQDADIEPLVAPFSFLQWSFTLTMWHQMGPIFCAQSALRCVLCESNALVFLCLWNVEHSVTCCSEQKWPDLSVVSSWCHYPPTPLPVTILVLSCSCI